MQYDHDTIVDMISHFLERIGIELTEGELMENTFLPGINIHYGQLIIDRKALLYPGDILHEAGHIAVAHPTERSHLMNDLSEGRKKGTDGEELGAILWSYAAAAEIGIPTEIVFHEHGYKGASAWLCEQFSNGTYIGLPLLVWMGMAAQQGEAGFPRMKKWLRE